MTGLRNQQLRFQAYLTDGLDDIEQDIVSTPGALAEHRLGAYYNAYRIRLIDALAIDFSALEKHLGREAFEYMALDYLYSHPSTNPSVRWVGQHLPAWLKTEYRGEDAEFVAEMASYEWAQTMVFDAADSPELMQLEDMAAIPPEHWPGLGFEFKPALQWVDLHWNLPQLKNAVDNGQPAPERRREDILKRWLLWRREFKTHWRSLDVHEAWALEQSIAGARFAAICEGLLEWVDADQVALVAAGFLKQWIGDSMVVRIHNL